MPPDFPAESPSAQRPPRFTMASWIVLLGGLVLTFGAYQWAMAYRRPGEWLPGIAQLLIGSAATAVGSFACALTALLRRERRCALAALPLLAGLGTILYFAWNFISKQ